MDKELVMDSCDGKDNNFGGEFVVKVLDVERDGDCDWDGDEMEKDSWIWR